MPNSDRNPRDLEKIYQRLFEHFGPQHWWPARSQFEVIVGAILTQNTNWKNVEKAIANLRRARCLTPLALKKIPVSRLADLIKPAGYFNIKARRLKNFVGFLFKDFAGNLKLMAGVQTDELRTKLLAVNGVGPETADSILLYALERPVFVVDAYTKRIFSRHGLIAFDRDYLGVQETFMGRLKRNVRMFNEYHALIVRLGKDFCRTRPDCAACPLRDISPTAYVRGNLSKA